MPVFEDLLYIADMHFLEVLSCCYNNIGIFLRFFMGNDTLFKRADLTVEMLLSEIGPLLALSASKAFTSL